jgi:hypothetical protein
MGHAKEMGLRLKKVQLREERLQRHINKGYSEGEWTN